MTKKIDRAYSFMSANIAYMRCPICGGATRAEPYALICGEGHSFDIARKGYVNFIAGRARNERVYKRRLFEAREEISRAGLYSPLCDSLAIHAANHLASAATDAVIDVGCGGGYITRSLLPCFEKRPVFALDISKEGISFAAGEQADGIGWIVADMNKMPFASHSAVLALSVMSPSCYEEFARILAPGGILIKVIHGSGYLKELRHFIYGEYEDKQYSENDVFTNLARHCDIIDIEDISYTFDTPNALRASLYDMTPLTSDFGCLLDGSERSRAAFIGESGNFEVGLEFRIAVCRIR